MEPSRLTAAYLQMLSDEHDLLAREYGPQHPLTLSALLKLSDAHAHVTNPSPILIDEEVAS